MRVLAAINHGVCSPARCRACGELLSQLWEIGASPLVVTDSRSALEGARRTLEAALHLSHGPWDRVLYIEDDAVLAPDAGARLLLLGAQELPPVLRLFSADPGPPGNKQRSASIVPGGAFAGAVAVLLSWTAVATAVRAAPQIRSSVPVERLMVEAGRGPQGERGDGCVYPSIVQHRGDLESVHRPGRGGQGTYSPSFAARYEH